jgi:Na+/proline symporter
MVENAYKVTLVVAFVPLVAGLYWKRASNLGAYLAIGLGLATWLPMEFFMPEGEGSDAASVRRVTHGVRRDDRGHLHGRAVSALIIDS